MPSQPATDLPDSLSAVVLDQPESMGKPTLQRAKLFPDLASALADTEVAAIAVIVRDPAVVLAASLDAGQSAAEAADAWKARAQRLLAAWRTDRRRVVLIDAAALEDRGSEAAGAVRRRFGGILPVGSGTVAAPASSRAMARVLGWALAEQMPELKAVVQEWRTAVIADSGPVLPAVALEEAVADWREPHSPVAVTASASEIEDLRLELDKLRSRTSLQEAVLGLKCLADGAEIVRLRRLAAGGDEPPPGPAPVRGVLPSGGGAASPAGAPKPAGKAGSVRSAGLGLEKEAAVAGGRSATPTGATGPAVGAAKPVVTGVKATGGPGAALSGVGPAGAPAKAGRPLGGAVKAAKGAAKPAGVGARPAGGPAGGVGETGPAGAPARPGGPKGGVGKPAKGAAKPAGTGARPIIGPRAGAAGPKPAAVALKPVAGPGKAAATSPAPEKGRAVD